MAEKKAFKLDISEEARKAGCLRLEASKERIGKWNRLCRIIMHFLEAETDNPTEGYLVLELLRDYVKRNYDGTEFSLHTEETHEAMDKWISSRSEEKRISN